MDSRGVAPAAARDVGAMFDGDGDGASDVDLTDSMHSDMSRLLAVTREENEEEAAAAASQPAVPWAAAAAAAPAHAADSAGATDPTAQAAAARRAAAAAAAQGDDATAAFVAEVLTLVDEGDIEALKQLQQRTCVRRVRVRTFTPLHADAPLHAAGTRAQADQHAGQHGDVGQLQPLLHGKLPADCAGTRV